MPGTTPEPPLTSIVMLTLNELEHTRRCVESIRRHTPEPWELVVVDNGSRDGSVEWLRAQADLRLLENERNMGFGGGCNQGIAASRGDRVLLLNNDTVATPGWLSAMHAALDADPRRGIVGPRSNNIADPQRVEEGEVGYDVDTLDGLDEWAAQRAERMQGTGFAMVRVIGFCMLLRREVLDHVGGFDVRFGLGNFEDDDLCLRAGVAGWECWVADDSFVHHVGSRTFIANGIDHTASMSGNWQRFARKWQVAGVLVGGARGYDPGEVLAATRFDPAVHYAPIVAQPDDDASLQLERRGRALLVPAERHDPATTHLRLRAALGAVGPGDDVTVVVRVDPRDAGSLPLLESIADEVGDERLPDIVLVEANDDNDESLARACDAVLGDGFGELAWRGLARMHGAAYLSADTVAAWLTGEALAA